MKVQLVADPKTIWSFWTVKWNTLLVMLYTAAGAGWLALNEEQRALLMSRLGISAEDQALLVAVVLFVGAFTSALTIQLRALKQAQKVDTNEPASGEGPQENQQ